VTEIERAVGIAVPATYVVAVTLIGLELLLLGALGALPSRRTFASSVGSGALTFGFMGLAQALLHAHLLDAVYALYDFSFWLGHVAGHRVRLLWCFHAVHHTTPEMTFTAAIRGSALDFVYLPWFFLWIPLLGVPPGMLLVVESVSRTWGVLSHVSPRLVGRLGPLEGLLVTPSAHRVHHGTELPYLDRNYGEVLALWDRLFGTYAAETSPPRFGLVSPLPDERLATIQLSPWRALAHDLRRAPDWRARLRYLFDAPGWTHDGPDQRVSTQRRLSAARPAA
jgi:sterol desaturase/sphingolipid hydroxylase (fatty acid hydroxylase superfamily)